VVYNKGMFIGRKKGSLSMHQLPSETGLKLLWQLFWSFFKISPVSFGGGYAMLPVIEREVMTYRGWVTSDEMSEVVSISGAAPGGIGVNAAAFIGYKVMGWRGLLAAVAGIMLPTFIIVLGLGIFFSNMRDNPKVMGALQGIQMAVIALIAYAGVCMARSAIIDRMTAVLLFAGLTLLLFPGIHPILLIPLGIVMGIVIVKFKERFGLAVRYKKRNKNSEVEHNYPNFYFGEGI
jgi:chromate transporter